MTAAEMKAEIRRLAPFHHRVELPHGLNTYVEEEARRLGEYTRVSNLVQHAFPALLDACGGSLAGQRVLDVACNCGGFSVEAAAAGSEDVLGIDLVDRYIEQAQFIKQALGLERVEFKVMEIEDLSEATVGLFDVSFCFGILYHLEDPVRAMKRIASVTKKMMLVDTTVMLLPRLLRPFLKQPLWKPIFPPPSNEASTDATASLWRSDRAVAQFSPNEPAVVGLLKFLGFSRVEKIQPTTPGLEGRYNSGRRVTFLAVR